VSLRIALAVSAFLAAPGALAQAARFADVISKFGAERWPRVLMLS